MEQRLPLLIQQAYHYTVKVFDEAVRPHGVTAHQLGVLNRIATQPGISAAEVSRQMYTTPQAAQLMLQTLERKGLIERKPDPHHGRIVRATLTVDGDRIVRQCRDDVYAVDRRLTSALQPEELAELVGLLSTYLPSVNDRSAAASNGAA